jgi:hypothetical protein
MWAKPVVGPRLVHLADVVAAAIDIGRGVRSDALPALRLVSVAVSVDYLQLATAL